MAMHQAQAEGLCLRYPDHFPLHPTVTYEMAVNMLLRAVQLAQQMPFHWSYVDKPQEGQVMLLFLPQGHMAFPIDGIRYQDQENRISIPAGSGRELEVFEIKCGFVPNSQDTSAWRVRRRYRLSKGGHPQIFLVHWTRGPSVSIIPSLMMQPVRSYPLRQINEPAIFVLGDKAGQKVFPPSVNIPAQMVPQAGIAPGVHGGAFNAQAMLAQQNSAMQSLENRRERDRARDRSGSMGVRPPQPRVDEDDSADEADTISTRTLALTRYRRNHELMSEVFTRAAFGEPKSTSLPAPYSIFDKSEMEDKISKLQKDLEELEKSASQRRAQKADDNIAAETSLETADMSTDAIIV